MKKKLNAIKALLPGDLEAAKAGAQALLTSVEAAGTPLERAEVYHLLGLSHFYADEYKDAIKWYGHELRLRQKLKDAKATASVLNNLGAVYYNKGNLIKAKDYYDKALTQRIAIHDERGMAGSYDNIGTVLLKLGRTSEALDMHFNALKINETSEDSQRIGLSLQNIGLAYYTQGDLPYALKKFEESLAIARQSGDQIRIIQLMINNGATLLRMNEPTKARRYYRQCYEQSQSINYHHGLILSLHSLADIERNRGNYRKSITHYLHCINIAKTTGHRTELISALSNMGQAYGLLNDFKQSLHYLHEALLMAQKTAIKESVADIYKLLSHIYESQNDHAHALNYYKAYVSTRDDLINKETTQTIHELKTKYEVEKKEKESEINRLKNIELKNALEALRLSKQQSDELLLNILPANVAEELKHKGSIAAQYYEQATVMFIDIKDFTRLSEHLTPHELVQEIDTYFSLFDSILDRYPIEKIKTIGDAYLCVAGLPVSEASSPLTCLRAAIEIRDTVRAYNIECKAANKLAFEFRFGVHAGPVIAGVVGKKKFEYDVWGDTVNTAARMEQNSEAGKINISGETYQLIKNAFECTYRGKIEAKNKGLVDMYFVEKEAK